MRRLRVGIIVAIALVSLTALNASARELTAADQAFLKKKIIARWNITGKNQIAAAMARDVDIMEDHPNAAKGYFTVLVSSDELDALRADGYSLDVVDPDWYKSFANKSTEAYGGFLTWDQAVGFPDSSKLDSFHTAFPSITSPKFSLGLSYEGRDIWAMKISDNPGVDEDEPEVLITGIHHAREPISMEIVLQTMRTLLTNYGTDSHITQLVNEREVWFVPFVNPDGYVYNEFTNPTGGGMWRKNRQDINFPTYGVDPNRNYGYNWGYDNSGSSPTPSNETYRGTGPFSEPEIQTIRDFVNTRNFVIAVNFHSYANLFLWAPGYADIYSPDEGLFEAIGDTVTSFNGYSPEPGWGLYNTNGDSDDWMYYAKGIYSFTPECGGDNDGFWPDPSRIPALLNENVPGNLVLIDLADTPERIFPPALATWIAPDTVITPDYSLQWSDPGGLNGAVSFKLKELFGRTVTTDLADADSNWSANGFSLSSNRSYSGAESFWGGSSNDRHARLVSKNYYKPVANDTLRVRVWYNTEQDWDYGYVEVSSDYGHSWATLPGNITTNSNPHGTNRGNGITGTSSNLFKDGKFALTAYVGQDVLFRFSYETDQAVVNEGIYFDNIYPVVTFASEVVLDPATPNANFPVTGKLPGTYYYSLQSTDSQSQTGPTTPPHAVTVDYVVCDCHCHADPTCDGSTNILDVVDVVAVAFRNAVEENDPSCLNNPGGRTDVDCSGSTDVIDVVKAVGVAFRNESPTTNFCDPCAL